MDSLHVQRILMIILLRWITCIYRKLLSAGIINIIIVDNTHNLLLFICLAMQVRLRRCLYGIIPSRGTRSTECPGDGIMEYFGNRFIYTFQVNGQMCTALHVVKTLVEAALINGY
jgi:hypothetical protein